jgi:hypothetical protein
MHAIQCLCMVQVNCQCVMLQTLCHTLDMATSRSNVQHKLVMSLYQYLLCHSNRQKQPQQRRQLTASEATLVLFNDGLPASAK